MNVEFRLVDINERRTTQRLALLVDGAPVWPVRGLDTSLEIQIDDLLSHLTEFWKPLMLRQTYPLDLNPARPSTLLAVAKDSWAEKPAPDVEWEDEQVDFFRDCHDLSKCFGGYFDLPPLWIFRSGDEMLIDTGEGEVEHIDFGAARLALETVGDAIAARLNEEGPRWGKLISAWKKRDQGGEFRLLSWATSLDEATARDFAQKGYLEVPKTVTEAANDNNELRIAARMASALPHEQIEQILKTVRSIPSQPSKTLEVLASEIWKHLETDEPYARPFEQGEAAARYLRSAIGYPPEGSVNIFDIAQKLGVNVILDSAALPALDGLAVSGQLHGPAAWLNTESDRHAGHGEASDRGQVRVTLAHELCHLLLDGRNALGAVEVLRSRMPKVIEQRAKAFAGELLLPTEAAMNAWRDAHRPMNASDLDELLQKLCDEYTVSKSVASWKVQHGARELGAHLAQTLDIVVPRR